MSSSHVGPNASLPYRIAGLLLSVLILGYVVVTGQLFLGLLGTLAVAALALVVYFVYLLYQLFYRLVVAVEHLAYEETDRS